MFDQSALLHIERERCSTGDDELGVFGDDDIVVPEHQSLCKHLDERRIERERSALEDNGRDDFKPLCEASKRLLGNCVERRCLLLPHLG